MSTIASPRPSIALSSRRTSTSTDRSHSATRNAAPGPATGALRRNRAALRDYYNLKATTSTTSTSEGPQTQEISAIPDPDLESELDTPGFDPQKYVQDILAREGLEGVMRVEAALVSEIRTLDGEKKALVYDNYSKLIKATETIRRMRLSMDPLTPATEGLEGRIGGVVEMATGLAGELRRGAGAGGSGGVERQRELVRWVIGAPGRLRGFVMEGRMEEAEGEWRRVEELLDKWAGVAGVENVRKGCEEALRGRET